MRGIGRTFQRRSTWWIAYSHRGKEYRESSGSTSEAQARKLLKKRVGEIALAHDIAAASKWQQPGENPLLTGSFLRGWPLRR